MAEIKWNLAENSNYWKRYKCGCEARSNTPLPKTCIKHGEPNAYEEAMEIFRSNGYLI
jgi:hypothetical protein